MTDATFDPDTALPCTVVPSPNHGDRRGRMVDAIVLHYTGMPTAQGALRLLCDPAAEVSSHYLIDEDGTVLQLVPESRRAWHAGRSFWQGERDINSVSVGIEIANPGHAGGVPPFPDRQIAAVIALCLDIVARHEIPAGRILAHSDIAPDRKIDPGEAFPWSQLAAAGVGLWIDEVVADRTPCLAFGACGFRIAALQQALGAWGFDLEVSGTFDADTQKATSSFQRRFRAAKVDGVADAETVSRLGVVLRRRATASLA